MDYFSMTLEPYKSNGSFDYAITSELVDVIKPIDMTPIMHEKYRFFYEVDGVSIMQVKHQSGLIKYELRTSKDYKTQALSFVKELIEDM